MIKTTLKTGLIAASLLISTQLVQAEIVKVPVASQAQDKQQLVRPKAGLSEQQVLDLIGDPVNASAPVGDPPIASWEYPDFYVFFEYDKVLHSVLKHQPKGEAKEMDAAAVDPSMRTEEQAMADQTMGEQTMEAQTSSDVAPETAPAEAPAMAPGADAPTAE